MNYYITFKHDRGSAIARVWIGVKLTGKGEHMPPEKIIRYIFATSPDYRWEIHNG